MHTSDIIIIYFLIKNMKYLDLQKCKEFSCVTRCFMDITRLVYMLHPLQNQSASHPLTVYVYLQASLKLHN